MRRKTGSALAALTAIPLMLMLAAPAAAQAEESAQQSDQAATLTDLIVAAAESGATPDEISEAAQLPAEGGGSLTFDEQNRVVATVFFDGPPSSATLDALSRVAVVDRVIAMFATATVQVAPERLAQLTDIPGVLSAAPALNPTVGTVEEGGVNDAIHTALERVGDDAEVRPCSALPIEADVPLRADLARAHYEIDGSGITVGIISDSFAVTTAPTSAGDDVRTGALPGIGNPCGYLEDVEVLREGRAIDSDEGRAMAQLVHGIAPGAKLLFSAPGASEPEMAYQILELAQAGADIIVDDLSFPTEAYHQTSFIGAAIEQAKNDFDVAYFTSAGNALGIGSEGASEGLPVSSWQTNAYRPMECPDWVVFQGASQDAELMQANEQGLDCMDFDPSDAEQAYDTLHMIETGSGGPIPLSTTGSVGEPIFGVTTQLQAHYYVEQDDETLVLNSVASMAGGPFAAFLGASDLPSGSTVRMVLVRVGHDATVDRLPAVYVGHLRGGAGIASRQFMGDQTHDWVGESVMGHAADGSALSVASAHWDEPTTMRDYSSVGPGTQLFEAVYLPPADTTSFTPVPANRLPKPVIVNAPHIASVDGTQTTFFGEDEGEDGESEYRFYGTSAAAPNAAAVAALGLSYRPQLTGAELSELVVSTARTTIDDEQLASPFAPRFEDAHVFGTGLVDALGLLEAIDAQLPAPTPAAPTGLVLGTATTNTLTFAWDTPETPGSELTRVSAVAPSTGAPVDRYVIALFAGDPLPHNAVEASQLTDAPLPSSYTFAGLAPDTRYTVQLTAYAAGDRVGTSVFAEARTLKESNAGGGSGPGGSGGAGGQGSTAANPGTLSNTGSQNTLPWLVAGGSALIVAAAALLLVARRRSVHAEETPSSIR